MPTYQYACTNPECGNRFELVQSFTDPNASECPVCGGPVRKVFSPVGVVFKGSGFYRNDSRKDSGKKSPDAEPSTKSDAPAKPDTAAAKPAAASGDSAPAPKPAASGSSSDSSSNGSSKRASSANPAAAST
jgi:putative FmdB family regulatory protein